MKRQIELNEWREVVALLSKRIYCIITYRRTHIKKLQRCSFYTIKHKDLGNIETSTKSNVFLSLWLWDKYHIQFNPLIIAPDINECNQGTNILVLKFNVIHFIASSLSLTKLWIPLFGKLEMKGLAKIKVC